MNFQDHFSGHAADYAAYRPTYPVGLFRYLAGLSQRRELAWDCATGNGQAAVALAPYFDRVVATDASQQQLERAEAESGVEYLTAPAEKVPLESCTVDLVTVAQALHWFDIEAFHREVMRVLRPGGFLAAWCYGLSEIDPEIDPEIETFHFDTVGPYWPLERRHIESRYESLEFPYEPVKAPAMHMEAQWTAEGFFAYLRTWSAVKRCITAKGVDPVAALEDRFLDWWGPEPRVVRWPLTLKIGRCL